MIFKFASRMLTEPDKRAFWKFAYNFGFKGMRSVQKYKRRLKQGEHFPPFLFISIINSCQLRCQGCWVDVAAPRQMIALDDMNRIINDAKKPRQQLFRHPRRRAVHAPATARHPGRPSRLLFPDFHQRPADHRRSRPRAAPARQRQPAGQHRGNGGRQRRAPRPADVLNQSLAGLRELRPQPAHHRRGHQRLPDRISTSWSPKHGCKRLIELGVHYVWFHTYRVVGPKPLAELALRPEQVLDVRRFIVNMRAKLPIAIVDAYWDDKGEALCPMATGISHHIGPSGEIEPCPIIQFATETIHDGPSVYDLMNGSEFHQRLPRNGRPKATRGCIVLERPDLVRDLVAQAPSPRHDPARHRHGRAGSHATAAAANTTPATKSPKNTGSTASPRSIGFLALGRIREKSREADIPRR